MSGSTYVTLVYASAPLNLRLSPGDRSKDERKMLFTCGPSGTKFSLLFVCR
jgi:hypothetical protein